MAELDPIKISVQGTDKVIKSMQQIQAENKKLLDSINAINKTKFDALEREITELKNSLRDLQNDASKAKNGIESIDKTVKFASFRQAAKSISTELVNIGAIAVATGKSASENINSIGSSIAGVAANFGPIGIAISATLTVLTPLIAGFFELSEGEKAATAAINEASSAIGKEQAILEDSFDTLRSATSNYSDRKAAIEELQKLLPGYFDDLSAEKNTVEKLNEAYILGNALIRERAIKQAFLAQRQEQYNRLANIELIRQKALEKTTKGAEGAAERNAANAEYQTALSRINQTLRQIEIAEENALATVTQKLTIEQKISIEKAKQAKSQKEQAEDSQKEKDAREADRQKAAAAAKAAKDKKDAQEAKDVKPLSENVEKAIEELNTMIEDPTVSIKELNKSLGIVKVLTENYLGSLGDLTAVAKAASDEISTLSKELSDNATKEFEASEQRRIEIEKVLALSKVDANAVAKKIALTKELAEVEKKRADISAKISGPSGFTSSDANKRKALLEEAVLLDEQKKTIEKTLDNLKTSASTQDRFGNIVIGTPNQTKADLERIKKVAEEISKLYESGKISADEARKRFKDAGIRLGFVEDSEKVISDVTNRNKDIKSKISKLNVIIDKESAEEELKERERLTKATIDAENKIAERQRLAIEAIYKRVSAQTGATGAAELAAGKQKFDKFVDDIENSYQDKLQEVAEKNKDAFQTSNSLVPNLFKFDDDAIIINEQAYKDALSRLSNEEATAVANAIQLAKETNRELQAINIQKNSEIFNANMEYINKISQNYKTLNAQEIEELKIFLNRQKILTDDAQDLILKSISQTVAKRRELGEEQTTNELDRINQEEEKSLVALESYYQAETALRTNELKKKIELAEEGGANAILFEEELANELLKIEIEKEKAITKNAEQFEQLRDKKKKPKERDKIKDAIAVAKELQNFSNALIDLLNQQNQQVLDGLNEQLSLVEQAASDTLNRISSLEDDLEGKRSGRREAVLQALEQQRQIEEDLAKQKIALAKQVEAEEKKINKRKQAAAIANAIINGALAITNVFGTTPPPLSFILAGITAATTAVQVATISSQKFAKGGFTGDGGVTDETGHKVAGVVHNDEWVAPKWMVESPKFGGVINQLENARTRGFAEGGFTSPDFNSLSNAVTGNPTARLESMLQNYAESNIKLANRPVKVSASEVQNVANTVNTRKARSTI